VFEEDDPFTTYRTPTESHLCWHLIIFCGFAAWALGGSIAWAPPFLIAIGLVGMLLYFMHGSFVPMGRHPIGTFMRNLWPFWVSLGIALAGLYYYPVELLTVEKTEQYALVPGPWWLPANTAAYSSWLPLFFKGCLLITAYNLLEISTSSYMLKKLLTILATNAMLLATLGYLLQILDSKKILLSISAPHPGFFATFTHPDHWGAFAFIWSMVALSLIAQLNRQHSWRTTMANRGVWFITGTLILISTLFIIPSPLYQWLFCLGFGLLLIHTAILNFRHKRRTALRTAYNFASVGIGVCILVIPTFRFIQAWMLADKDIHQITPAVTETTLTWSYKLALYEDAWSAFCAKPLFGWGHDSFERVLAFYQNADISDYYFASAHSDLLEMMVENGLLGTFVWLAVPGYYFIKFFRLKHKRTLSYHLFGSCVLGLIAALIDFPFQNPAFTISFWIIFFSAYSWSSVVDRRRQC